MALSQLLEDSPLRSDPRQAGAGAGAGDLYNETHRLALEELLSRGLDSFLELLRKEKLPNFLSDREILQLRAAAVAPPDPGVEQSLCSSIDCSSVTYFPDVSDLEPPLLELGWPAFTAGSYRGVTRAVAHFQPGYGDCIYGCKEAARRMIQGAREVIAIVTDSLTDLDIFKDLREACTNRKVPVYILLDQSCSPAFLKMCRNIGICLDDLQQMRVRTITGTNYYTRSGVRVTGKVHERFMLIDGNKVATGSYRFNWTDGKLNSSNLIELSGQVTEKFDEEFRILYAQSSPVNAPGLPGVRNGSLHASLLLKHSVGASPQLRGQKHADAACLTSTPTRKLQLAAPPSPRGLHLANPTAVDEPEHMQEEILAGNAAPPALVATIICHASTQTSRTDFELPPPDLVTDQTQPVSPGQISPAPPDAGLGDSHKPCRERQRHYAIIRAKLEHMVTSLSQQPEPVDAADTADGHKPCSRPRTHKDDIQQPNARLP